MLSAGDAVLSHVTDSRQPGLGAAEALMFDDFGQERASKEGRGRRGVSAVLSIGVFSAIALGVGGAIAAHQVHQQRSEQDQDVSFDDLPQVKAPKPAPVVRAPSATQRKAPSRKPVVAPKTI